MDTGMDEVESFTCLIGPELMNNIMSYLSPRDIYSLGETIPEVKKIIYTNTAIQSAMFEGGHSRKSVENLYHLVNLKCIIVPNAWRVIHLCTSKKCEMCFNERRYDRNNCVYYANGWYGALVCYRCIKYKRYREISQAWEYPRITRAWKKTSERYLVFTKGFDCILNHPKVAAYGYGRSQWFQHNGLPSSDPSRDFWMTSFPLFEKSTGERFGPVVSYTDVDPMADYLLDLGLNNDSSTDIINRAIDKYIEDHLFTSTNEECNLFTRSYLNNLEEANLVKRNKINDHATKRWKNKKEKLRKVKMLVKKLSKMVDRRIKERVLAYTVNVDPLTFRYIGVPVITWQYGDVAFLNQMMKPYVSCPSMIISRKGKIIARKLTNLVPQINNRLLNGRVIPRWRMVENRRIHYMDRILRHLPLDWMPPNDSDSDSNSK